MKSGIGVDPPEHGACKGVDCSRRWTERLREAEAGSTSFCWVLKLVISYDITAKSIYSRFIYNIITIDDDTSEGAGGTIMCKPHLKSHSAARLLAREEILDNGSVPFVIPIGYDNMSSSPWIFVFWDMDF